MPGEEGGMGRKGLLVSSSVASAQSKAPEHISLAAGKSFLLSEANGNTLGSTGLVHEGKQKPCFRGAG